MTDEERSDLKRWLDEKYKWFWRGSKLWSAAHHWSLGILELTRFCGHFNVRLWRVHDGREDGPVRAGV